MKGWMIRLTCVLGAMSASAQNIGATKIGSRIDVTVDGDFFTSYRFSAEEKYPFFFPVNGPSGASVTSMRNGTFPHHSSLFFGCDMVNGGNYWQEGLNRGQIVSEGAAVAETGKRVVITETCNWTRPGADQPFRDTRRITISAPSKTVRQIDFDITMEALIDVEVKKTNHSLFSARMDPDLSVEYGGTMVNAQGDLAQKGTGAVRSPWIAYYGPRGNGKGEGLAILQHPSNPWYPAQWLTRDYGFISPTPFQWPPDDNSITIKKGETWAMRYRVLVFGGDPKEAQVGERFAEYAQLPPVRLLTLDPGHFHAALVQKQMYPRLSPEVNVYAPEGPDLEMHLKRIDGFNTRADAPAAWKTEVYRGDDFAQKMIQEKKGNVVVLSGNNAKKTQYILDSVKAGFNVLADKPMAITPQDFDLLKEAFAVAAEKKLLLYDIMTERYEITTLLQRHFIGFPDLFGKTDPGTPDDPSVTKESVHHFSKTVAGAPLQRPPWFFDVKQQGEGIVDVTTHLVDLVQWELFPGEVIKDADVKMLKARTFTTAITPEQFTRTTSLPAFPDYLQAYKGADGNLQVPCNGEFTYTLRGVNCKISVIWNYEAPPGAGDTHYSLMRGTKLSAIIRQGKEQGYKPMLYLEPRAGVDASTLEAPLQAAVAAAAKTWPGVSVKRTDAGWEVIIPDNYHNGHEAHFGQVAEKYLGFLDAGAMPAWEVPNMTQKYRTIMEAYKMSR
ncbi:MAG: PmoA family protein [Kiritimatiellaeota bacterium]|nr:PmoA family protein [Kiritimatiellota bacterium]